MRMPSPGKIISHPPEFMKMGWIQGKLCFTFPRSRLDNTGWPRCFFMPNDKGCLLVLNALKVSPFLACFKIHKVTVLFYCTVFYFNKKLYFFI